MSQLEQRLRESELQMHSALMGRGAPYTDMCLLRLQVSTHACTAFSLHCIKTSLWAVPLLPSVCVCDRKPSGKTLFESPVRRMQRLLYQGEARSRPRLGAVEAETQRLNEVLKENSEKHAEALRNKKKGWAYSSFIIWPPQPHMSSISLNLWFEYSSCVVAVYYKDPKSRQAYQQLEKEVSEGVGAEQRKTAADWDARAISGWPSHYGRLPGPAQKGTALSDGQPTKQTFPLVSQQLLIMLNLRFFSYGVLPDAIIAPLAPIYHTSAPVVFFILK